jgi:enediyne polyketide synthase
MRIYDTQSTGFLPGEGCGFVVLMRSKDALLRGLRIYAFIPGWGVSSDGGGGITRPEMRGQRLALERAYKQAGYGVETVLLFEGHGTGTPVGDEVELAVLSALRREAGGKTSPAALGSIKANIGHTKAAAGVAGLIKATLAVHNELLPPTTGVHQPRPEVEGKDAMLRVLTAPEPWPDDIPLRAGINSFGFGGINVHVTLEGCRKQKTNGISALESLSAYGTQDVELFLLEADKASDLADRIARLAELAPRLSYAELADVSTALLQQLGRRRSRAAVVAATPGQLSERLTMLLRLIKAGTDSYVDPEGSVFLGTADKLPRIAFLFPGQASPVRLQAGIHGRRFRQVNELYGEAIFPEHDETKATNVGQLAIVMAELAGIRVLHALGLEAAVATGHSLGELSAYCWAEALDKKTLTELVRTRARIMSEISGPKGAMASISATVSDVESLIRKDEPVVVACFNALRQIVISGERAAVERVMLRAQAAGWTATLLSTSQAFHSPLMSRGAEQFRAAVTSFPFRPLRRSVVSTITGGILSRDADLQHLVGDQFTSSVRFVEALAEIEQNVELFVEVGPGRVLTNLVRDGSKKPAIALDIPGVSLAGVLQAVAAAFVMGAPLRLDPLLNGRFTRPLDLDWHPHFFSNPCELAPQVSGLEDTSQVVEERNNDSTGNKPSADSFCIAASDQSAAHLVLELVARRTELPVDAVSEDLRLLRDLHLNSIVVGEIVSAAARKLGVPVPRYPLQFADSTVGELAQALEQQRANGHSIVGAREAIPVGVDEWVRAFRVDWAPRPLRGEPRPIQSSGRWQTFGPPEHPLLELLAHTLLPGDGVIVCLSASPLEEQIGFLLTAAQAVLRSEGPERYFVVIAPVPVAGAFARTLGLECPDVLTRVITSPPGANTIDYIRGELSGGARHVEARYDAAGRRYEPCFRALEQTLADGIPVRPGEVVLVSGGGKGIAAECAMTFAQQTGTRLVLLGRSKPDDDPILAAHLHKMDEAGVQANYLTADVANLKELRAVVETAENLYGRIIGVVHGAGHNEPRPIRDLDLKTLQRTFEPKVQGFRNLLAAVNPERLRLLVTFGSVIGRVGMPGEADYALANSYLSYLTEEFGHSHPQCRCLAFESSAWSEIGMAERLGRVGALRDAGITCIRPAEGISWFNRLLARSLPAPAVVVTGRLGLNSPIPIDAPPLPLLRFLERPGVHYPGVELIADSELTLASDPYLSDHVFQGQCLLPAVIGLEAMVQVARAVTSEERIPVIEDVRFDQPIVVDGTSHVTVRIVALVEETGEVEVRMRSSQTSFQIDHFRCRCVFRESLSLPETVIPIPDPSHLPLNPSRDLYGPLLFQGSRFQRLVGYRRLTDRFSWADIAPGPAQTWFGPYLPSTLALGDPAARDAALHSVQACIPHALVLPVGVDRLWAGPLNPDEMLIAHANQKEQHGDTYTYDLEVRTSEGKLRESWEGLRLRKLADTNLREWPDALAATFLEWRVREAAPSSGVFLAFERDHKLDRRRRTESAIQRAVGTNCSVHWRKDGKPQAETELSVSAAHTGHLTLAAAGWHGVACDLEPIRERSEEVWRDLLGSERLLLAKFIASQTREDLHVSATRVWTALETLVKADGSQGVPLSFCSSLGDHGSVVLLEAPGVTITTAILQLRTDPRPVAIAVLARNEECVTTNTGIECLSKRQT